MNHENEGTEKHDNALIDALKLYGRRAALYRQLDDIHAAIPQGKIVPMPEPRWKKILTISAVAASVSVISVVATLWVMEMQSANDPGLYVSSRRENVREETPTAAPKKDSSKTTLHIPAPKPAHYTGTGFLISPHGYAVTSYHVVKDADSVYLENEKYGSLKVRIVHNDPANDVSIVQIISADWKPRKVPYVLSAHEAQLGEKVYTLGFPREDIVFGEGSVSASSGYEQDHNAYQVSIPVNPGNSGGPLLNERGDLIGIITGFQSRAQGTSFATKSQAIINAAHAPEMDTLRQAIDLPQRNTLQGVNRIQQIQRMREFVFIVRVYKN